MAQSKNTTLPRVTKVLPSVTPAPAEFRMLALSDIIVTRNTRQVFAETELAELAESIKTHGILQPVMVRLRHGGFPAGSGAFELVVGGRRYRAAHLAGLTEIPATIRSLTDREFLEIQLLENLQRQDVHPAEEATAFAELLASNFSAEEIGARIGKPARFVLQRAKLQHLNQFWKDALQEGRLPILAATELARLPLATQERVQAGLGTYGLESTGAYPHFKYYYQNTAIQSYIRNHIFLDLHKALFPKNDPDLYPLAGACTTCPKRTGNHCTLFEDLGASDRCLDSACFDEKKKRFVPVQVQLLTEQHDKAPLLVSSQYGTPPAGTLSPYSYWAIRDEQTPPADARLAVYIDGSDQGKPVWITLRGKLDEQGEPILESSEAKKAERKAEREKTMAANRAKRKAYTLLVDGFADGKYADMVLTHFLSSLVSYPSKELMQRLTEHYQWVPDSKGERSDKWVDSQIKGMTYARKLELYFDVKMRDGFREFSTTLNTLADKVGLNMKQLGNV